MVKENSVVMLSGGLDSAVNLAIAASRTEVRLSITFDYGQTAYPRELEAAKTLSEQYGSEHKAIPLPWFREFDTALNRGSIPIPHIDIDDLEDPRAASAAASAVWVPNRNGVFSAVAAAFAESLGASLVIGGFNAEEASTFPDNGAAFVGAATAMFSYSTLNKVKLTGYTIELDKSEVVREALKVGLPLESIWSCYSSGDLMCGRCEPCARLRRAFGNVAPEQFARLRMEA